MEIIFMYNESETQAAVYETQIIITWQNKI